MAGSSSRSRATRKVRRRAWSHIIDVAAEGIARVVLRGVNERQVVAFDPTAAEMPKCGRQTRRPLLMAEQSIHPGTHDLGQRQQANGVSARSGIENHEIESRPLVTHQGGYPPEQGSLCCTRCVTCQVELTIDLVVETWMHHRFHLILDGGDVMVGLDVRVDFQPPEVICQWLLEPTDVALEDVAKGVSGVGRDEQAGSALVAGRDGQCRRGRGLTDTAFASHEDEMMFE